MNCVSSSTKPPSRSRATRCTKATFEASVSVENMLSPKNAPPMQAPYSPPTSLPVFPALHAMREAKLVQFDEQPLKLQIDPGFRPVRARLRASRDGGGKIRIRRDLELIAAHGFQQAARQVKFIQRQNPAMFRVQPMQRLAVARFGHREHSQPIRPKQQVSGKYKRPRRHGANRRTNRRVAKEPGDHVIRDRARQIKLHLSLTAQPWLCTSPSS